LSFTKSSALLIVAFATGLFVNDFCMTNSFL
jgi:hypothetical protein